MPDDASSQSRGAERPPEIARRYTLRNRRGTTAVLTDAGASLMEFWSVDRNGGWADVVLGHDAPQAYLHNDNYFGCTVGRVANRISLSSFECSGARHTLTANEGEHHLHGGAGGFSSRLWRAEWLDLPGAAGALRFSLRSADGEEGYPGNLDVSVTYQLDEQDGLLIEYQASTDKTTPVNLTNHSYWNLAGEGSALGHTLQVQAGEYLEVDAALLPTGRRLAVAGDAFDFRYPLRLGDVLKQRPAGVDHCFVLNAAPRDNALRDVALLTDHSSGRSLQVATTEPCLQVYSGNVLDRVEGKSGRLYAQHSGICLEAQGYINAPNRPEFPAIWLQPGEVYRQRTRYRCALAE
ncbi:MAG: aldose epimerase family protein [Halioglobus sp.]